jgi:glutamate racemase
LTALPFIGVRDSGVGGLTVARCIRHLLPHAPLLYFADTAHVPYGDRAPHEVRHFALSISQFLIEQGAQVLVFACNTTSAHALEAAQQKFSVPVFGMIEPGAKAALQMAGGEAIGVLATQSTVDSEVYLTTLERLQSGTPCWQIACPEFVPLVENEQSESVAARRACRHYLAPLREAGVRTVILGCTHYPLLLPLLQDEAPEMVFVDPAEAVAREVACLFEPLPPRGHPPLVRGLNLDASDLVLSNPCPTKPEHSPLTKGGCPLGGRGSNDVYFVSGLREGVQDWIAKLMNDAAPDLRRGPVFDLPL